MRRRNHGGKRRSFFSGIAAAFDRPALPQLSIPQGVDRPSPFQHRLRLEPLEDRRMLTVFMVDSLDDTVADDGFTTLREAIQAANTNTELWGGAVPAGSPTETAVIRFAESLFTDGENPVPRTITLGGTQLSISGNLDIEGPGADLLSIDANQLSRVFSLTGGAKASLADLTVTGGTSTTGGGISNSGILTVINSTISSNSATGSFGQGGGVYNRGKLTVANSTISGNSATGTFGRGSGVYSDFSTSTVTVIASTISDNSAGYGGGFYTEGSGSVSIVNSTISGNSAKDGGGIYCSGISGPFSVINTTITANSVVGIGGGMYGSSSATLLHNSVIAGNSAMFNSQVYGTVAPDSSHNLIGFFNGLSGISNGVNGNQIGLGAPIDPLLGPLQDNGGPTWTHAPLLGSPLLDAGSDAKAVDAKGKPLLTDHRGFLRLFGIVDIGAVELQPPGIPVAYDDGFVIEQDGMVTMDVLSNDFCNDGSRMTAVVLASPAHGALAENPDGTWTYTPEPGFWGVDVFGYQAINGEWTSNTAQVFVSVLSPTSIIVTTADDELDGDLSPGDISLREALAMATPGSTIQFSAAMLNQVIRLTYSSTATLSIADVQIVGPGSPFLTIDGNARGTVFRATGAESLLSHLTVTGGASSGIVVNSGADLSLDNMVVAGNRANSYGGGVYNNNGVLTITNSTVSGNSANYGGGVYSTGPSSEAFVMNSTVSGNSARDQGGGIHGSGTLNITNSTITGNTVSGMPGRGGGVYGSGAVTISNSIVSGNTANGYGGGIHGSGTLNIISSTIAGNTASQPLGGGGGIYLSSGSLNVGNSTIAGNLATGWGGGVYAIGSTILLNNSIIAVNAAPGEPDIRGTLAAGSGYNLIGIDPGFVRNPSPGGFDWGDLRLTEFSPAVDMGDTAAVPEGSVVDFDGNPRVIGASVDIGAHEFQGLAPTGREAASIVVTTLADTFDPYDGETSLREALFHAGHDGLDTAVAFDPALAGGTITLDGQPLFVDHAATIDASTIGSLTIDADRRSRVLTILSADQVELASLTVTGGGAQDGGGIGNFGSLAVSGLSIVGNVATGISNGMTIVGNVIVGSGGGLYSTGTLTIANSTISGNANTGTAGSGGGVCIADGTVVLTNSIVAANASPSDPDIWGPLAAGSRHNLIGVDPGFVRDPGPGGDGKWGTADDDQGNLRLTEFSPAIDMGDNDAVPEGLVADLDGNLRIVGARVDIGVYEFQSTMAPSRETPSVVVTTLADTFDPYDGQTSLREALFHAGQSMAETTVTFDAVLDGGTMTLDGRSLVLDHALRIDASMLGALTVDADGRSRAVTVVSTDPVELVGLTVTGGVEFRGGGIGNIGNLTIVESMIVGNTATGTFGYGGGIYNAGNLAIADSIVSSNTATGSSGRGGGIGCYSGNTTVTGSNISDNHATGTSGEGGGIYQFSGTLGVMGSIVSGNTARSGGGICSISGAASLTNTTIAGNRATASSGAGGIHIYSGTVTASNSIVALNTASSNPDVSGSLAAESSHNLIGGDPGFVRNPSPGDDGVWGTADDDFGDLRLRIDSPAVNAGSNALAIDAQGNPLTVDLDGNPRISGPNVDIGAYEYQFPRLPGDADWSGTVDAEDAKILAANWGKSGMTWADGDFNNDGLVNAIDAAILAAHFGATIAPPGETAPTDPLPTVEPVVVDVTPLIGPLPLVDTPAARQPIAPAQRQAASGTIEVLATEQRAYALHEVDIRSAGGDSPEAIAATDAVLAEEFGPAVEQGNRPNRHAAWLGTLARRQTHRPDASGLDRAALAVDLLLADR